MTEKELFDLGDIYQKRARKLRNIIRDGKRSDSDRYRASALHIRLVYIYCEIKNKCKIKAGKFLT